LKFVSSGDNRILSSEAIIDSGKKNTATLQENRSGAQFPQQVFDPIEGLLFSNL
jgi:hypothetical protein